MSNVPVISFDDTAKAFAYKSNKDLKRANFLFASMSNQSLVRLGTGITPWLIKIGLPIKGIIRNTIFKQFVGGESLQETSTVAKKLGANMQQLNKNLSDPKIQQTIDADTEEAKKFGISGTPGFIINGVSLKGAYPAEEFKKIIDKHLAL